MTAVFSVLAADPHCSAAKLTGGFERTSLWFLEKHLAELEGDIVLDCSTIEQLDEECVRALREFIAQVEREGRRVVFRAPPATWEALKVA